MSLLGGRSAADVAAASGQTRRARVLVAVSAAQLGAGIAGQLIALRDRRSFALPGWRGRTDRVGRDSWLIGTGLSAPVFMLTTQAVATARLAARPGEGAMRTLGTLGAAMTVGSLMEEQLRAAVTPGGWDRTVTPIGVVGCSLAAVMAGLGLRRPSSRRR
jgi:hypothetical protein